MTPAELAAIRIRLEKARFANLIVVTGKHRRLIDDDGVFYLRVAKLDDCTPEGADMLAHAPSDVRMLLAEVDRLQGWVHDVGQAIWQARYDIQTGGGMGMAPGDQFPDFAVAVSSTVDRMVAAEAEVARLRNEVSQ